MSYPMKEVIRDFGNSSPFYREMTPKEYELELNFYRAWADAYILSTSRREREYGEYLKRWFSEEPCDGYENYEQRHRLHKLPQTANGFMFE